MHVIKRMSYFYITVKANIAEEVTKTRSVPGMLDASLSAELEVTLFILDICGSNNFTVWTTVS